MEPDTNQVEMSPRNRRERRREGMTEPRVRKALVRAGYIHPVPAMQPKGSLSSLFSLDAEEAVAKDKARHQPRVKGEPRTWQAERERRTGQVRRTFRGK